MKRITLLITLASPQALAVDAYLPPQLGYPNVTRYQVIQQQQTQQQLNELAPKAATDPEAARRYRELSEFNARQVQILTDPTRR